MNYCNKWGQGQLFAFSGLDGESGYIDSLCGYLSGDKVGIRFVLPIEFELYFANLKCKSLDYSIVASDIIKGTADNNDFSIVFFNRYTLIGTVPPNGQIKALCDSESNDYFIKLKVKENKFSLAMGKTKDEAEQRAETGLSASIEAEEAKKFAFFDRYCKKIPNEKLYCKCLSVMKTQIYTPEGNMKYRWSTPDRFPHRSAWIWDSIFHAIGFRHIDTALSQELIKSVFTYQSENGFIPHFFNSVSCSKISQPPIIAYGAWKVFEKSQSIDFLKEIYEPNKAFLSWYNDNRRKTSKYLYTWLTEPMLNCRCGESGMDNSTRFDTKDELFAIDLSCFMANDYYYMSLIADKLGSDDDKKTFLSYYETIKNEINETLWDDETGSYLDYNINKDELHDVKSVASFLPLFTRCCTKERAVYLVNDLENPDTFATEFPIPCIAKNSKYFGDDMWRGPVWINFNYMIAEGLKHYGYKQLSDKINEKTIQTVDKYYKQTGCLFEFFDSLDEKPPYLLNRKGHPVEPYNPLIRYQSIRDYGWTTTLTFDLLNG